MKHNGSKNIEFRLERVISYLLIAGVITSLLLEAAGVVLFYLAHGHLIISQDPSVFIRGRDFFSFIYNEFRRNVTGGAPVLFMAAGIVILILTPFIRVILSVFFFSWGKNAKYVLITLFVLIVITVSFALH